TAAVAAGSVSVTVTGASLGLLIDTSAPDNYALVALGGTDSLNGVTGLTLTGNDLSLQVRHGGFPSPFFSTVPAGVFTTDVSGAFSTLFGGTSPATFTFTNNGGALSAPVVVDGGTGYLNGGSGTLPLVLTDAAGSGASGTATVTNGVVTGATITAGGTGYDASTAISVPAANVAPATFTTAATFTFTNTTGHLSAPVVANGGTGCLNGGSGTLPLVFTGGGSGATGTATITNGKVTAAAIITGGTGYGGSTSISVSAPSVTDVEGTVTLAIANFVSITGSFGLQKVTDTSGATYLAVGSSAFDSVLGKTT